MEVAPSFLAKSRNRKLPKQPNRLRTHPRKKWVRARPPRLNRAIWCLSLCRRRSQHTCSLWRTWGSARNKQTINLALERTFWVKPVRHGPPLMLQRRGNSRMKQRSRRQDTLSINDRGGRWVRLSAWVRGLRMRKNSHSRGVSASIEVIWVSLVMFYWNLGKFMQLPANRIRQIINLDSESAMITKEALMVIGKATE